MRHYKLLFAAAIFGCVLFTISGGLQAQDSCVNGAALLSCADMNLETCRDDASCSGDTEQAITATDVVDATTERCCARSTTRRQNRCIRVERRKMNRARKAAPTALKPFIRNVRRDAREIDCSTNSTITF